MNKIIIYCDNHWFSPIAIKETIDQVPIDVRENRERLYFLGDNFDRANCKHSDLERLNRLKVQVESWLKDGHHIDGNHELEDLLNTPIIIGKVCMVHGDFESWGAERALRYRTKPAGSSMIKLLFTKTWNAFYDQFFNSKIKKDFLERSALTAKKHNCTTLIVAHKHPKSLMKTEFDGVKIIVLPRGRNIIDIDLI